MTWLSRPRNWVVRRDECREFFVYAILDGDGTELYVGRSCRPEDRWKSHLRNPKATWTDRAASFKKIGPFHYAEANRREREWIQRADPIGNFLHTSRYVSPRSRKDAA